MLNRLCFALVGVLALIAPLRGQNDGPIKMTPEFPLVFPLTKNGNDVTVQYPVLINPTTVLKPGMVLRILYVINYSVDGSTDLTLAHEGNKDEAYSRSTQNVNDQARMPAQLAHELEGYRRTVWQVPNNFVLAMAQYPTETMHLIYSPKGTDRDIEDARFSFLDGIFVGLPDGKVSVIAVEKESKADEAGLKAGDEIVAVGGAATNHDLSTFETVFVAARKQARENNASSYSMTIRSAGQADTHIVNVPTPAKLKSLLMQGL